MTRALKPLGTGELLDQALRTLRSQFRPLLGIVLTFQLLNHAAGRGLELFAYARFPGLLQLTLHPSFESSPYSTEDILTLGGIVFGYLLVAFLLWQSSVAALALPPGTPLAPPALSPIPVLKRLLPSLPRLIGTLCLEALLLGLATLLGMIPPAAGILVALDLGNATGLAIAALGIAGGLVVALGAFLVVLLRFVLVPQIVVIEGLSYWKALARSSALMQGRGGQRFWDLPKVRGSILILVIQLVTNGVVMVVSAPQALISFLTHSSGATPALGWTLLAELLALLGESCAAPFGLLVLVAFYLDLRVRREGLDLELAVAQLSSAA